MNRGEFQALLDAVAPERSDTPQSTYCATSSLGVRVGHCEIFLPRDEPAFLCVPTGKLYCSTCAWQMHCDTFQFEGAEAAAAEWGREGSFAWLTRVGARASEPADGE